MRTRTALTVIGATAALGAGGAVATGVPAFGAVTSTPSLSPASAGGAIRHVEGRIVAVSGRARTFTVRDRGRGTVTLHISVRTRFDRIAGFSALRAGERVEVRAAGRDGRLIAAKVEPVSGGRLGSAHNGGAGARSTRARGDDPIGHDVGDDRGGRRGSDDGPGHDRGDDHGGGRGGH